MEWERLQKQMDFLLEIDKAKNIFRQSYLSDGNRKENDAEHSWHLAMMAFVLAEYFGEDIDVCKTMKMVLMHDVVEIDAGDTYCYDAVGYLDKAEREQNAAVRLYGLLPEDQKKEYMELWQEFEEGKTAEAYFANVLDRLQPVMLSYASGGKAWLEHDVHVDQLLNRNEKTLKSHEAIKGYFMDIVKKAVEAGYLKSEKID